MLSITMLYISMSVEHARKILVSRGESDRAEYFQAKSNSFLFWALGWAILTLVSVNGFVIPITILGAIMILCFILRL